MLPRLRFVKQKIGRLEVLSSNPNARHPLSGRLQVVNAFNSALELGEFKFSRKNIPARQLDKPLETSSKSEGKL